MIQSRGLVCLEVTAHNQWSVTPTSLVPQQLKPGQVTVLLMKRYCLSLTPVLSPYFNFFPDLNSNSSHCAYEPMTLCGHL